MVQVTYERRSAEKAIVLALREMGGSGSRKEIRRLIADNGYDGFTQEDIYSTVTSSRSGKDYCPFMFDFSFSLKNLYAAGMVQALFRGKDVELTQQGINFDLSTYRTKEQDEAVAKYWEEHAKSQKKKTELSKSSNDETVAQTDDENVSDELADQDEADDAWKTELLNAIKKFSPAKFERFSRMLVTEMGVKMDKSIGVALSGDHGLDGFGYFQSDDFRTSRVAIQCKRYDTANVGEAQIRDFIGSMYLQKAEYGIFITTSYFTPQARAMAVQGDRPVTLIDGQALTDLIEKYQLKIHPVTTYKLDDYYYEED